MFRLDSSNKRRKGQAVILFTVMVSTVLVPMVGLAIDGTRSYIVKAKLSAAVDGGAIAAARLLASGSSSSAQVNNAIATAKSFVAANFPDGFFSAKLLPNEPEVCVDLGDGSDPCHMGTGGQVDTYKKRTIVISAKAQVQMLFMRIAGYNTVNVAAQGRASRRDVRVVLVIDKSYSMHDVIDDVKAQAQAFVGRFAPGRDEVGLVVFDGSAIVAYPARDITKTIPTDPSTFKPPDTNFSPTVSNLIGNIKYGSNTGMAEALYLSYMTLKADAATNSDLPNKLNVIVLFTDGLPDGITVTLNKPGNVWVKSSCTNYNNPSVPMTGWTSEVLGFNYSNQQGPMGLYTPMMTTKYPGKTGKGDDIAQWMAASGSTADSTAIPTGLEGCNCNSTYPRYELYADLKNLPKWDIYGNRVDFNPTGVTPALYEQGDFYKTYGPVLFSWWDVKRDYQVGLASWNATANQAWRIWNNKLWDGATPPGDIDDPHPIDPVIFTIGYQHTGEVPDLTLLKIIANTTDSPVSISSKMHGKAYLATSSDAVAQAFAEIASEILRFAQ